MPKCNLNKFAKQLYRNHTLAWVFFYKLTVYFQNTFFENSAGGLLLVNKIRLKL